MLIAEAAFSGLSPQSGLCLRSTGINPRAEIGPKTYYVDAVAWPKSVLEDVKGISLWYL